MKEEKIEKYIDKKKDGKKIILFIMVDSLKKNNYIMIILKLI